MRSGPSHLSQGQDEVVGGQCEVGLQIGLSRLFCLPFASHQNRTTLRLLSPACMRSKPLLICAETRLHRRHSGVYSGMTWSPGTTEVTPVSISRTTPTPNPGCHDLYQHFATLGPSRSSSRSYKGRPAAKATAARVFILFPRLFKVRPEPTSTGERFSQKF